MEHETAEQRGIPRASLRGVTHVVDTVVLWTSSDPAVTGQPRWRRLLLSWLAP